MKKQFTLQNLQNGDIVEWRTGLPGIILKEQEVIIYQESGMDFFANYTDNMLSADDFRDADIMRVYRGIICFSDYQEEGNLIFERDEDEPLPEDNDPAIIPAIKAGGKANGNGGSVINDGSTADDDNELISIIAQAFYGNRTGTEVRRCDIDRFILGCHTSDFPVREPIDRTILTVPGAEHVVFIYNKYAEEKILKEKEKLFQKERYIMKPLAFIPEQGIEIYSRCIVCGRTEDGKLESLKAEDYPKFMKYLAE